MNNQLMTAISDADSVDALKSKYANEKEQIRKEHEIQIAEFQSQIKDLKSKLDLQRAQLNEKIIEIERDKLRSETLLNQLSIQHQKALEQSNLEKEDMSRLLKNTNQQREQNQETLRELLEKKIRSLESALEEKSAQEQKREVILAIELEKNISNLKLIHQNELNILECKLSGIENEKKRLETQSDYNYKLFDDLRIKSESKLKEMSSELEKLRRQNTLLDQRALEREGAALILQQQLDGTDEVAKYKDKHLIEEIRKLNAQNLILQEQITQMKNEEKMLKFNFAEKQAESKEKVSALKQQLLSEKKKAQDVQDAALKIKEDYTKKNSFVISELLHKEERLKRLSTHITKMSMSQLHQAAINMSSFNTSQTLYKSEPGAAHSLYPLSQLTSSHSPQNPTQPLEHFTTCSQTPSDTFQSQNQNNLQIFHPQYNSTNQDSCKSLRFSEIPSVQITQPPNHTLTFSNHAFLNPLTDITNSHSHSRNNSSKITESNPTITIAATSVGGQQLEGRTPSRMTRVTSPESSRGASPAFQENRIPIGLNRQKSVSISNNRVVEIKLTSNENPSLFNSRRPSSKSPIPFDPTTPTKQTLLKTTETPSQQIQLQQQHQQLPQPRTQQLFSNMNKEEKQQPYNHSTKSSHVSRATSVDFEDSINQAMKSTSVLKIKQPLQNNNNNNNNNTNETAQLKSSMLGMIRVIIDNSELSENVLQKLNEIERQLNQDSFESVRVILNEIQNSNMQLPLLSDLLAIVQQIQERQTRSEDRKHTTTSSIDGCSIQIPSATPQPLEKSNQMQPFAQKRCASMQINYQIHPNSARTPMKITGDLYYTNTTTSRQKQSTHQSKMGSKDVSPHQPRPISQINLTDHHHPNSLLQTTTNSMFGLSSQKLSNKQSTQNSFTSLNTTKPQIAQAKSMLNPQIMETKGSGSFIASGTSNSASVNNIVSQTPTSTKVSHMRSPSSLSISNKRNNTFKEILKS